MTMDDDAALARLRAADPAGPDPDLTRLEARVLGALAEQRELEEQSGEGGSGRVPRWLLPAAAGVVAVAIVGSAGFALGRSSDDAIMASAPAEVSSSAVLPSVAAPMASAPQESVKTSPEMTAADSAPADSAASPTLVTPSSTSPMVFPGAPTIWSTASSVPDAPSVATGYALSSTDVDREALAGELAALFGITEAPELREGAIWQAGALDGSGPSLAVGNDGLTSWSFYDPQAGAVDAQAQPLDADRAERIARGLLRDAGVPVRSVEWQVEPSGPLVNVTAWQLVSQLRTGLTWNVTLAPDGGLVSASGFAAGLVPVPGYELIGAASAVERIAKPGWSALGPSMTTPPPIADTSTEESAAPASPRPAPRANGRPTVTATVMRVRFTGSTVALAPYWQPDGTVLILPSYLLDDTDGGQWSLLGIADRYVRFVEPEPGTPMPLAAAD